jgi:CheY-like chemotaxis protein
MTTDLLIKHILLAEDDEDDCTLFEDVLNELVVDSKLTIVQNGHLLMEKLIVKEELPDIIFLDLNMPLKNGLECLKEIKKYENLKKVPVIIFSTSVQADIIDILYQHGANFYIQKPDTFLLLKSAIQKALSIEWNENPVLNRNDFFWKA